MKNNFDAESTLKEIKDLSSKKRQIEKDLEKNLKQYELFAKKEISKFAYLNANFHVCSNPILFVHSYKRVLTLDKAGWGTYDFSDKGGYGIPIEKDLEPMEWEVFDSKIKDLAKKLCASYRYSGLKLRTKGGIESIAALKFAHKDKNVYLSESGRVISSDYGNASYYYIASIDGVMWAFWNSSYHGGDPDTQAQQFTSDWEKFEDFLSSGTKEIL